MNEEGDNIIKTTARSLDLLNAIKDSGGATVAELEAQSDLNRSTIYKHLNTMVEMGYLTTRGDEYFPGYELFHLGEFVKKRVVNYRRIKRKTDELKETLPEQVEYGLESNGLIVGYLPSTEYDSGLFRDLTEDGKKNVVDYAGSKAFMHSNALGKALLAQKSDGEIEEIIARYGLPEQAKKTVTSPDELFRDIDVIREQGYATTDEEWDNGLREVGIVVEPTEGVVLGGFNVFGPVYKIDDRRLNEELPRVLREYVAELEEDIVEDWEQSE
ncbi:IclR family transcriptional regulator [Halococcus hamelinensis]|uniref:IclR family transcriptional regulator n=1 Tax=Halococcus hamelinensis 100A6 TaxID=1132509 RepID=M0LUM3_9EURY|nr:IclR family transcriptional regulator [Halococcus hamelinensis]EMA37272.1 IclR family transcriptional regulator [Halococcus hamelinensis 100A6]